MSQKLTDTETTSTTKTFSNTKCRKIGIHQWSCSFDECDCHLKPYIKDNKQFIDFMNKLRNKEIVIKCKSSNKTDTNG